MPMRSQAQNAAMHAAAEGKSSLGIPKSVGEDYVNASHGESVKSLPEKAGKKDPPKNKASHHLSKAMEAAEGGDYKTAAHHTGHAIRHLGQMMSSGEAGGQKQGQTPPDEPPDGEGQGGAAPQAGITQSAPVTSARRGFGLGNFMRGR